MRRNFATPIPTAAATASAIPGIGAATSSTSSSKPGACALTAVRHPNVKAKVNIIFFMVLIGYQLIYSQIYKLNLFSQMQIIKSGCVKQMITFNLHTNQLQN